MTLRGKEKVVVVSSDEYDRLTRPPRRLIDVLRAAPIRPEDVDTIFARKDDDGRPNPFDAPCS